MQRRSEAPPPEVAAIALVSILTTMLATASPGAPAGPPVFTYQSGPNQPEFTVTTNGLATIRLNGQTVAEGTWQAAEAAWLDTASERAAPSWNGSFNAKSLEPAGVDRVRVYHTGSNVAVTTEYGFHGEDVEIRTRIENRAEEYTIRGIMLGELVFRFARAPDGLAMNAAPSVITRMGEARYHPSFHNPFGGSYLADEAFGVGASALRNGWLPTVLWWPVEVRTAPTNRPFRYVRAVTIPPGSAARLDCTLRVSANTDWRHLLEPYRDHFRRTHGPVRYRADYRPFGSCQGSNDKAVSPDNPYGWQWPPWRFDRLQGVTNFAHTVTAVLRRAGAQGVLVWAHDGWHPRGCNFRPDFDVLPPEMDALMPELTAPFQRAGLRFGVLARPQIVTPDTWTHDTVLNLSADEPSQMAMAAKRFDRMIGRGVTAFYVDTFGSQVHDARALMQLREGWGTNILVFTEYWSDASLVYGGGYAQYTWDKASRRYKEFWRREPLWEVCRWLVPGAQLIAAGSIVEPYEELPAAPAAPQADLPGQDKAPREDDGLDDDLSGVEKQPALVTPPDLFRFLMEQRVTPFFHVGTRTTPDMADRLRALGAEFLDGNGRWKE